ncbi:hypothetical protein BaRGS_00020211, partial [Batillaria attramentaria]
RELAELSVVSTFSARSLAFVGEVPCVISRSISQHKHGKNILWCLSGEVV